MARKRARRIVFVLLLAAILIAALMIIVHILSDRPLAEIQQVQLLVIAPGGEIEIGGRPFGEGRAVARLTGLEDYCFEVPETMSPSRTLQQEIAGGQPVVSEPKWDRIGKLEVYTYPHLFPDLYVYKNSDGTETAVRLLIFRHSEHGRLMGVTVSAQANGEALRFREMKKSREPVEDWWHERVLKQRLTLWQIEVGLGDAQPSG